jgi:hypothetical protein
MFTFHFTRRQRWGSKILSQPHTCTNTHVTKHTSSSIILTKCYKHIKQKAQFYTWLKGGGGDWAHICEWKQENVLFFTQKISQHILISYAIIAINRWREIIYNNLSIENQFNSSVFKDKICFAPTTYMYKYTCNQTHF